MKKTENSLSFSDKKERVMSQNKWRITHEKIIDWSKLMKKLQKRKANINKKKLQKKYLG